MLRHRLFKFYVREWASGKYESWEEFVQKASYMLWDEDITKLLAPPNSLLAKNLETILSIIREHYHSNTPQLKNVLLYFHIGADVDRIPKAVGNDLEIFELIDINYSEIAVDQFIEFDLEMENKSID